MTVATREEIVAALLARLNASGVFQTVGRRLRDPESLDSVTAPALFLLEDEEDYHRQSVNLPPRRTLRFLAAIYTDAGQSETAVPSALLNPLLDAIDAALKPDDPTSGRCTLGGAVYSALIAGTVKKYPGDATGKGAAVVPIEVMWP